MAGTRGTRQEPFLGAGIEVRVGHGLASLALKDYEAAERDFIAAAARWGDYLEPEFLLGKTYALEGKAREAEQTFVQLHGKSGQGDRTAERIARFYCNQDGTLNPTDCICLVHYLFLGTPSVLPCNADAANQTLMDFDGQWPNLNIADGVRCFSFLFLGGPPHVLGLDCVPIADCPSNCAI